MSRLLVVAVRNRGPSKEVLAMKITRRVLVSIIYLALAIGMLIAPATTILATAGSAAAAPTTSTTIPLRGHGGGGSGHGGGGSGHFGGGSGGARVGAPSAPGTFGGSHERVWQYEPGVTHVPHVDGTVHQSR
jgi:hypothetical protein